MEITPYSQADFEPLLAFLRKNWAPNHAVFDKELFDWQYGGPASDASSCLLLTETDGAIKGFLGAICYTFLYNDIEKKAAGLAVWVVDKEIRNSGLGLFLRKTVEDNNDVVYTIGINLSTVRYYNKRNYMYYESLHRYVAPLDAQLYHAFLAHTPPKNLASDIEKWIDSISFGNRPADFSQSFDSRALSKAYKTGIAPYFSLRPQKDESFWEWRYLKSKGFSYLFHQSEGGIVISRIEETHAPGDNSRHGLKCFRIIEIVPSNGEVWNGELDLRLVDTLSSVLLWAHQQGCVLADFQISSARLGHVLKSAGFRLQQGAGITNVARLFAPYRENAAPLNFAYRVSHKGDFICIDRDDVYLIKSDVDMDRPNYLC